MTRLQLLQNAYSQYDSIYSGLILISVWVAGTGHLLDWVTAHRSRITLSIFWSLVIILYLAGMLLLGLAVS